MADQEPLMSSRQEAEVTRRDIVEDKEDNKPTRFVWLLTVSAGISGLLFGYDTGVISSTLVSIHSDLSSRPLTTLDKSLITASTSLCALFISPIAGNLATTYGRKRVLLCSDILFVFGALLQAVSGSVWLMITGRGIIGFAVGAASFVTPMYIGECAPRESRGKLVTLNVLFVTLGQVVAYVVGWLFAELGGNGGWRWMVGLGGLPALAQGVLLVFMPESPRWLVAASRADEARRVLAMVYGKGSGRIVDSVVRAIDMEVREEIEAKRGRLRSGPSKSGRSWLSISWFELFRIPGHRRALTIACLLQGLQQLCGFNSLMYFSATLFSMLAFSTPTLTSLSVAIANMLFTLLSLFLIDAIGRRRILLLSIPFMILALLICAVAFHYTTLPSSLFSSTAIPTTTTPQSKNQSTPLIILLALLLYTSSYALGLGNVPWQQSELFPLSIRSLGSSLSTATNWGSNFIIGITFLPMLEYLSPAVTFTVYAGICVAGWVALWRIYPETSGLGLEEVGDLLRDGWGVRGRTRGGGDGRREVVNGSVGGLGERRLGVIDEEV